MLLLVKHNVQNILKMLDYVESLTGIHLIHISESNKFPYFNILFSFLRSSTHEIPLLPYLSEWLDFLQIGD